MVENLIIIVTLLLVAPFVIVRVARLAGYGAVQGRYRFLQKVRKEINQNGEDEEKKEKR